MTNSIFDYSDDMKFKSFFKNLPLRFDHAWKIGRSQIMKT